MYVLTSVVLGLLAGLAAAKIAEGQGLGLYGDVIVGIAGALTGGALARHILGDAYDYEGLVLLSGTGATLLLFIEKIMGSGASIHEIKIQRSRKWKHQ